MTNLISIIGNNGSGKTFILTYFASKFKKNIYSNYTLELDNYIPLTINDLIDMNIFNEGNIFIDEAYTWIESRHSGSATNLLTSYLIFQKRKRLVDVYLTEQLLSSIDKRARNLTNILIECLPRVNFLIDDFHFIYTDNDTGIEFTFMIPYKIAEKYFPLFDTYQVIESVNKSKFEYDLLKNNPKALLNRTKEIAEILLPELETNGKYKITHDNIKYSLLENNFDLRFEKTIYIYYQKNVL